MTAGLGLRLLPQPFEPMPGNPGVMGGVLGIAVAEIVLHSTQIGIGRPGNSRRSGRARAARRGPASPSRRQRCS